MLTPNPCLKTLVRLLLFGFLYLPIAELKPGDPETDSQADVCHRVEHNIGNKQLLCVGKMRHTLLIITADLYVYQIPMESENGTLDQLYLGHYKAQTIEEKWPKLGADSRYQYLKTHRATLLDVWTAVDPFDEYVNFETNYATTRKYAVLYGINKQTVTTGGTYRPTGDHLAFLSSTNLSSFYQLTLNNRLYGKHLTIERWYFRDRDVKKACAKHGHTATYYSSTYRKLCTSGTDQLYIQPPNQTNPPPCKAVDWPVLTGFVANGQFYLFGQSYIFSFPEASYDNAGAPVSLRKISYGAFIQCGGASMARGLGVSKKSPVRYGLIVAIILIIVLLCLCCILCLMREAMEARKRKKKGKKGAKSDSGWNPFSKGASGRTAGGSPGFRSSGLPIFGFLTGKKSSKRSAPGSKRSKGLDAAKSLSRRGGPATRRSVNPVEPGRSLSNKAGPGTRRSTGVSVAHPVTGGGASAPGTRRSAPAGVGSGKGILGGPSGGGRSNSKKGGPSGGPSGGPRGTPLTGGGSTGRSGTNNATGRSKGMASFGAGTNSRKASGRSARSGKATERSARKSRR